MSDTSPTGTRVHRSVRRTAALAIAGLLTGVLSVSGPPTASAAASGAGARSDRYERVVLTRINRVRARNDLRRLRELPCVDVLAEKRVVTPLRPVRAARVDARRLRRTCGRTLELEATRTGTPRAAVRGLLRQPSTRAALLSPDLAGVGVAAAFARGRGWRVTVLLAGGPVRAAADGADSAPPASRTSPDSGAGTGDSGSGTTSGDSGSGTTSGDSGSGTTSGGEGGTDTDGTTTDPATEDAAAAMDGLELAVLEETNRRRANHGLTPLQPSACAADFAGEHSAAMAESAVFAHADLADLRGACGGSSAAENIAMWSGMTLDARGLVQLWMESPGHRANILTPGLTHLGVGIAVDEGSGAWYATQDFLGGA